MLDTAKRSKAGEEARRPYSGPRLRSEAQLADRFRGMDSCCLRRRIGRDTVRADAA
jgi:hypothetical protein